MISSGLVPTRRAVIDINRPCNAKCRMCYYTYSQDENWSKPFETVQQELLAARERGDTSVDFTGGEPTIYPQMAEVVQFAESIGLHTCIISNGLAFEKVKKLAEAGCSEWLLSIHGFEDQQDRLLNVNGAWDKINRSARFLVDCGCFIRVNCTLTKYNYQDLPRLARHYHETVKPRVVNFINFNPHYEWGKHQQPEIFERLNEVQVKASEVEPYLRDAINYLDDKNYWVNVRYFPLCRLKGLESHVCNNPQVMFDPFEWDYGIAPKTVDAYMAQGRDFQNRINTNKGACAQCGMLNVCGGLHGNYAQLHGFSELDPYREQSDYPYHFRSDLAADIVVPAYKPNEHLRRLLAEIAEKSVPPYNVIVLGRQQSAARNRNQGLRASQNPYIIMCDDDIANLSPGWNRDLVLALKENPEITALSARLMAADGSVGRNTANNYDLKPKIAEVDMIPTACCIFRQNEVWFDERYIRAGWEDTDYFMQLRQKYGGKLAIANTIRVTHLNEEKNGGGVENQHNRDLWFAKWAPEECERDPAEVLGQAGSPISEPPGAGRKKMEVKRPETACKTAKEEPMREWFEKGENALSKNRPADAVECFDKVLREDPFNARAHTGLSRAYWEQGRTEDALNSLTRALELEPDDREITLQCARVFGALGKQDFADEVLKSYLERNPGDAGILSALNSSHAPIRSACPDEFSTAEILRKQGEMEFERGRADRAVVCFEMAIEKDPTLAEAHSDLGVIYQQSGNLNEALEHFCKALELRPDDPEILGNSARALSQAGECESAAELFRHYLRRRPEDEEAWSEYESIVRQSAAAQWNSDACSPEVARIYIETATKLMAAKDLTGSAEAVERALRMVPGAPDAMFVLASLHNEIGQKDEALSVLEQALETDPSNKDCNALLKSIRNGDGPPAASKPPKGAKEKGKVAAASQQTAA